MSSNWIKTGLKYALLLTPAAALVGLLVLVGMGAWVAAILRDPARFAQAPVLVQKFTRASYWHTRRHWHTIPECVQFDRELLYRPRPGDCLFENSEFRTLMHFDSNSARRTSEPRVTTGQRRPRLLILGDSHAMGWGVNDDETFASRLAAEYGYSTVNLGVSSYATARELRRLERDFELQQDDVVVIQYSDNDYRENRHFAETGQVGPYQPAQLEQLFDYSRTDVSAMPIAGLLLRELSEAAIDLLPGRRAPAEGGPDPTQALLSVTSTKQYLRDHKVLLIAINDPRHQTHLSETRMAAAGIRLVTPALDDDDFYAIDDHMRPAGHRKVARAIDVALSAQADSLPAGPAP